MKAESLQRTARLGASLYLVTAVLGLFRELFVNDRLIIQNDAALTVTNLSEHALLFCMGILSWLLMMALYIVVPLVLYRLLKSVHKWAALLMVLFLITSVPIAFVNELNSIGACILAKTSSVENLSSQVMFLLKLHEYGDYIGQIFWGLWLFPLGFLIFKSNFLPKIWGVLITVVGICLLTSSIMHLLLQDVNVTIIESLGFFEPLFFVWLLIRGVNLNKWETYTC